MWTAVLVAVPLVAGLSGCFVHDDPPPDDGCYEQYDGCDCYGDCNSGTPTVQSVNVDVGATMDAQPGEGVGVFVENLGAGDWDIWTTCDTKVSGVSCAFDVYISGDGLGSVDGFDLEGGDFIDDTISRAHVGLDTDYDVDGVDFTTFEGAPVRVEVWLDGSADASYVFHVENGAIVQGLPTNPADMIP